MLGNRWIRVLGATALVLGVAGFVSASAATSTVQAPVGQSGVDTTAKAAGRAATTTVDCGFVPRFPPTGSRESRSSTRPRPHSRSSSDSSPIRASSRSRC